MTLVPGSLPGGGLRNGLVKGRPYLSPAQRAVLAVVAQRGSVPLARLARSLQRGQGEVRQTAGSLSLCGMLAVREYGRGISVEITGRGRQAAGVMRS